METAPALDGDALRSARERAGFSQNDLARVLGLASGGRISLWERGEARPRSPQLLHALAAALATPVAELLESPQGGPTLRWLRFAAGLSVEELALATHTSPSSVKRWEAEGLVRPTERVVSALVQALNATEDDIRLALRP
jgi:transcriptional regulator with XRE-family HTH domain